MCCSEVVSFPGQPPNMIGRSGVLVFTEPVDHFQSQSAEPEKQEARFPLLSGSVEREAKAQSRPIIRDRALWVRRIDDQMVQP